MSANIRRSPPHTRAARPGYEPIARAAGFDSRNPPQLLAFPFDGNQWQLHHATPYAAVRWTNIYDPAVLVAFGDLISGPLAPVFGPGIIDVNLKRVRGRQSWRFTHTRYWSMPDGKPAEVPEAYRGVAQGARSRWTVQAAVTAAVTATVAPEDHRSRSERPVATDEAADLPGEQRGEADQEQRAGEFGGRDVRGPGGRRWRSQPAPGRRSRRHRFSARGPR